MQSYIQLDKGKFNALPPPIFANVIGHTNPFNNLNIEKKTDIFLVVHLYKYSSVNKSVNFQ